MNPKRTPNGLTGLLNHLLPAAVNPKSFTLSGFIFLPEYVEKYTKQADYAENYPENAVDDGDGRCYNEHK